MQISGLPVSTTFGADDVLAIEINGVTYKVTGATLAAALESMGDYVTAQDIANNLTTTDAGYVLDARQGKVLLDAIDALGASDVGAVAVDQGTANAGKALVVGNDGIVTTGIAGIPEAVKVSLLNCFAHVAWIDEHGQDYYDDLYDALYPDTGLVRITAVFTQGSAVVYPTTPLDDLKAYLTVTGYYNDGTSGRITDYALSGTLSVGTSTVTVIKDGKTTTFNVTVSQPYWDYEWSATSKEAPTMMQAYVYNFTDYASESAMFVDNFYIDFNHIGNCEILFNAKMVNNNVDISRTPQISIRGAHGTTGYNGFKIAYNTPSQKVETSASGTFEATDIEYNVYHEYRAKYENGVCYAYIDGTLVGQGGGVVNNAYLYMTGIFGSFYTDGQIDTSKSNERLKMAIKELKFKVMS